MRLSQLPTIGLLGSVVAALALGGCSSEPEPPELLLHGVAEPNPYGGFIRDMEVGGPHTVASLPVCVDGPGSVTISSVEFVDGSGMEITEFAMAAEELSFGAGPGTLASNGYDPSTVEFSTQCPDLGDLAFTVVRTDGSAPGYGDGFRVHYRADGTREASVVYPFYFGLCPPGMSTDECRDVTVGRDWVG